MRDMSVNPEISALVRDLAEALTDRGRTASTCESVTGGGIGYMLSSQPGSSRWFSGGLITYSPELKEALAGVPGELITTHGVVSGQVANAMARGARDACRSDYAVAVTGNAGPGVEGGKGVGCVFIAASGPEAERVIEHFFPGSRESVRLETMRRAIELLLWLVERDDLARQR